jgi:hypothetical protein
MAFTLKVNDDKASGNLVQDTLHNLGGYDMIQSAAFHHLFPSGECAWVFRELLYAMADLHGWRVSVSVRISMLGEPVHPLRDSHGASIT